MIKAVIFDCFGVLVRDGWLPFREKYFDTNPDLLERATAANKLADAGLISFDDFIDQLSEMSGLSKSIVQTSVEDNPPDEKLFEFIRDNLKQQYRIGLLSNAADNWLDELFQPWQLDLFDQTVLSCDIGMIKPDPRAYEITATKLGMLPEECLFIDDQERYCTAAEQVGMTAIWHKNTNDTVAKIQEVLRA